MIMRLLILLTCCALVACDSSDNTSASAGGESSAGMMMDDNPTPDMGSDAGSSSSDMEMMDAGSTSDMEPMDAGAEVDMDIADAAVEIDMETVTPTPELEVIATGSNIAGANGMHFGPDGLLYVASVIGSDLTVIDPESGEIVRRLTAAEGVIGPDDVAFASDGSFYWTSILTGEVAGFNAAGERVTAAQLTPGVNPITFSNDDRLFVAQCFLDTNVYEIDPAGVVEPRLIADDLGPGCGLNGMDWGPDNRLYGPRWFMSEVVSLDVDTGERRVEATGFAVPAAVKFDSEGILHVLDTFTGQLIRVVNGSNEVVATFEPGLDNFAFDAEDRAFVSSYSDGFVKRVNADGTITTLQPGGMGHPSGLAVVGDQVWVTDIHTIRAFNRETGEEQVTQRNVVGVSALGTSFNISPDGDHLILTSYFDGDVRVWNPETQERVAHYPGLLGPVAAARYGDGIAISEHFTGSVSIYGEGDPIVLASGLPAPSGLQVVGDALYVGDRELGQILRIAQGGEALETPEVVASDLDAPEGFVFTEDNGIVVVEAAAGRVIYIDAAGERRELATIPAGSPSGGLFPPSNIFNGVAMDSEGNLFISGEKSASLYRIKAPW